MLKTRSLFKIPKRSYFWNKSAKGDKAKSNYYNMLGIEKDATEQQIKMAYFKLAKTHHPDVRSEDKTSEYDFEEISEAYQTLKDPKKRRMYNITGLSAHEQGQGFGGSGEKGPSTYEEYFDGLKEKHKANFEKYEKLFRYEMTIIDNYFNQDIDAIDHSGKELTFNRSHSSNIKHKINLDFKELEGAMKREDPEDQYLSRRVQYTKVVLCHSWDGELSEKDSEILSCDIWEGTGTVIGSTGESVGMYTCTACKGSGLIIPNTWNTWNAEGVVEKPIRLSIQIPAGVRDGEYMRIK